jgi:hypothetical protein
MATKRKIKVEENPTLERDSFSNAILNTDINAYNISRNRKKHIRQQERIIADLQAKVEELLAWKLEIVEMLTKKENK